MTSLELLKRHKASRDAGILSQEEFMEIYNKIVGNNDSSGLLNNQQEDVHHQQSSSSSSSTMRNGS